MHKRPSDQKHYIYSIFIPISFGDDIEFDQAKEHRLISTNLLPPERHEQFELVSERGDPTKNLLWAVLDSLADYIKSGIEIRLTKRIPCGSGLGGGSSNAAQLLMYLMNRFAIPEEVIHSTARQLGSDITFFLNHGAQLVHSTGEMMHPISMGSGCGLLALPTVGVETAIAYGDLKRSLQPTIPPENWLRLNESVYRALKNSEWGKLKELKNDFERVVFHRHPELMAIKSQFLENGALYSAMSGSGSTIFALTGSEEEQSRLESAMRTSFNDLWLVRFRF